MDSRGFSVREGNDIVFFADGKATMAAMRTAILGARRSIHIAGWRFTPELSLILDSSPDERLEDLLRKQGAAGVHVRIMIWDSPKFPVDNRDEQVAARLADVPNLEVAVVDRGLSTSHHQKLVLVDGAVGFVGGVDLAGGRWDDQVHPSFPATDDPRWRDYQSVFVEGGTERPTAGTYDFGSGGTPLDGRKPPRPAPRLPWHDVHALVTGPAVADLETVFRGRWNKVAASWPRFFRSVRSVDAPPMPAIAGAVKVEVVASIDSGSIDLVGPTVCRTYERAYCELIARARRTIYIENQYFVDAGRGTRHHVIEALISRLQLAVKEGQSFEVVVVVPVHPDGDPATASVRELAYWQRQTIDRLRSEVGPKVDDHIGFFSLANPVTVGGTSLLAQIYVHSKLMIVDGEFAILGSGNLNARSMSGTADTEVGVVVSDAGGSIAAFQALLCSEHCGAVEHTSLLSRFRKASESNSRLQKHPVDPCRIWGWEKSEPLPKDTVGQPDGVFFALPPAPRAPTPIMPPHAFEAPQGSLWARLWGGLPHAAKHQLVVPISGSRVADAPGVETPLREGEGYFRLWLSEMFLAEDRRWFTEWSPAVHSVVSLQYGDERIELPYVAGPTRLTGVDPGRLNRVIQLDHALTPLLPYNGGVVELAVGLVALQGSNSLPGFLRVMGDFAGLLQVPQLSTAIGIATPLATGVQELLASSQAGLHLGYHQAFVSAGGSAGNVLSPGYVAVVAATDAEVAPASLWIRDGRLRVGASQAESTPLTGVSYFLLRVESRAERDDWASLKSISDPLRDALRMLADNPNSADRAVRAAVLAAHQSRDLTRTDKQRVVEKLKQAYRDARAGLDVS